MTAKLRLGLKPPVRDHRTLALPRYLKALPPPPPSFDGTQGITQWGMLANDNYGCCTASAAGHLEMAWGKLAGDPQSFTDQQVLDFYFSITGGQDDGAQELDVLKAWRANGLAGDKIYAFAQVPLGDQILLKQAVSLFTGLSLSVALPKTAQGQEVWDDTGSQATNAQPWSWGGHEVPLIGYDDQGLLIVTWGALKRMTYRFASRYLVEQWAIIPANFPGTHLDFSLLSSDLAQVSQLSPEPPSTGGCSWRSLFKRS